VLITAALVYYTKMAYHIKIGSVTINPIEILIIKNIYQYEFCSYDTNARVCGKIRTETAGAVTKVCAVKY
jgi:hypothetical protein